MFIYDKIVLELQAIYNHNTSFLITKLVLYLFIVLFVPQDRSL